MNIFRFPRAPVPLAHPEGSPLAGPARLGAPRRGWIPAILLCGTALTILFAGSLWEGAYSEAESLLGAALLVFSRPADLLAGAPFALAVLLILGAHEMGHYLACRRHGIPATLPFFLPGPPPFGTFGALIRIRGRIPDRRALFDVAAAGPFAGFCAAVPVMVLGLLQAEPIGPSTPVEGVEFGSPLLSFLLERILYGDSDIAVGSVYLAGWFGLLVTSLNLFPAGQLDGGHLVFAFSSTAHRRVAWLTILALSGLVVAQTIVYRTLSAYTVWWVVLLVMRDRHPSLSEEARPLDPRRRALGLILLLVFALSFIPLPIRWRA